MEFEKFIGGKFKTSTLPYIALKIHDVKLLVAGVRPWASHYLFFVLMVCNLGQDTFIDYLTSDCGLGQVTSLMIFFSFNVVQPWARHLY
jgi:hypothetical protein